MTTPNTVPVYEWRTIESAPKDTPVLVFMPTDERVPMQVGIWRTVANGHSWVIGNHFAFDLEPATHWALLPPPPSMDAERLDDGGRND